MANWAIDADDAPVIDEWDLHCIRVALAEARRSSGGTCQVGAVIANPGEIIAVACKDESSHAEINALHIAAGYKLRRATAYVRSNASPSQV